MRPTEVLREAIKAAIWPPMDDDPDPDLDIEAVAATDDVLATRIPQACQTCQGSGMAETGAFTYDGEPLVATCPDCPTLGTLLLYGWNLARTVEVPERESCVKFNGYLYGEAVDLLALLREVPT